MGVFYDNINTELAVRIKAGLYAYIHHTYIAALLIYVTPIFFNFTLFRIILLLFYRVFWKFGACYLKIWRSV